MGGCSSKNDRKASAPGVMQGDGNQTLLTAGAGGDRKQAVDAMVAAVRQAQEPHHTDTSIMMCPVFKNEPRNLQLWKAQCDAFYEAAKREDGMLSYGFAYSEAEGSGEVHIRQCYRDAASLLAHLRAVDVPLQASLKLSQLERVEVHGLASELAQIRQELTKLGETHVQFFEMEPTAMRRPAACSGEHGSDTAVSVSHRYQVEASGVGLVKSHAAALAAHAASAPGVDQHALSTSEDGRVQLQHGYADAEAAIKHLQDSQEHRVARLERHVTLERLEVHGPAAEIEKIKAFLAGACAQAGEAVADAAGAAQGAVKAVGDAAAEGATKAKQSAEAAMASVQRATLYVLDGRAIRRSFSSTVATVEGSVLAAEHRVEEGARAGAHSVAAGIAAAGAAVGSALSRAENAAVAEAHAAGAAASRTAHAVEAKAAAAAAAIGNTVSSAEHAVAEDVRAAGAAVSSAAHAVEAEAAVAAAAVGSAAASAAHIAAKDARAAESAASSAAHAAEAKAAAAAAAIGNAAANAEHVAAEYLRAAGAAASSAAHSAEAEAAASASATVVAVGAGVASAVAVVEGAVHPHHIDTTLTMCPYFKIQASNLQLWKAQCDAFYEKAKGEDGLLFYGFCFEEIDGDCEAHVRQGFKDAASMLAHLRAIDVPIQAALKLSQLERVEVHGPAAELWKVQAEATTLGEAMFQFFEVEAEPLRRTSPHAGGHGSDTVVSLCHYFDTRGSADAEARMRASAAKLRSEALRNPGLEHHGFAVDASAGRAHLGQGFRGADEAIASLVRDAATHRELAQVTGKAVRLEVHGPAAELVKIRAFIVQQETDAPADHGAVHAAEQLRFARLFALDERALRHAYEGPVILGLPIDQPATITLEVAAASPQRGGGDCGWGFFTMCRGY